MASDVQPTTWHTAWHLAYAARCAGTLSQTDPFDRPNDVEWDCCGASGGEGCQPNPGFIAGVYDTVDVTLGKRWVFEENGACRCDCTDSNAHIDAKWTLTKNGDAHTLTILAVECGPSIGTAPQSSRYEETTSWEDFCSTFKKRCARNL